MEYFISEKAFCEQEIEKGQKQIWNLKAESRTLERMKLGVSTDVLLQMDARVKEIKTLVDFLEKKQEVLKDRFKEITHEEIKIQYS